MYLTAALTSEGEVLTWGGNFSGQLRQGDDKQRKIPTKVESLEGLKIVRISCGMDHTAALTDKGGFYHGAHHDESDS